VNDLNTARIEHGGAGNTSSALAFGNDQGIPTNPAATEEWSISGGIRTITSS
jgi:hypothetical protein